MSILYYISISSYLGDSAALQSSVIEAIDDKQDVYPQGKQKKNSTKQDRSSDLDYTGLENAVDCTLRHAGWNQGSGNI